jgi:hypothetical protein
MNVSPLPARQESNRNRGRSDSCGGEGGIVERLGGQAAIAGCDRDLLRHGTAGEAGTEFASDLVMATRPPNRSTVSVSIGRHASSANNFSSTSPYGRHRVGASLR